ncbi:MAG: Spi family protease inhibitor [Prevotella sp.]|nr:Spi family protease inhibitor [Prevotella sp.]
MKKALLTIAYLSLCCIVVTAQHRSEQEAVEKAQEFFNERKAANPARLESVPQRQMLSILNRHRAKAKQVESKSYARYIVNDDANGRFVIVAADERMHAILGYSDNGTFNVDSIPEGLLDMLDGYDREYEILQEADGAVAGNSRRGPTKNIAPLVKSQWNQWSPYNDYCPKAPTGDNCVTGCVATAMAQVMNRWKYPATGHGSILYHYQHYDT